MFPSLGFGKWNPVVQNLIALSFLGGAIAQFQYMFSGRWWVAPLSLLIAVAGLSLRVALLNREKFTGGSNKIDFAHLNQIRIQPLIPWVKARIRGQDQVVDRLFMKIQQNLFIARPNRSLGTFLFVGPTGTGKTYLGELLSEALFPGLKPVIIRMNQYKSSQDVFTLLGAAPGTSGTEMGGSLTRPVMEESYRVIVLDEFEKAHSDVQQCFYDIFDSGQVLEKSSGRLVSFAGCVFIATCNAGAKELRALRAQSPDIATWIGKSREILAQSTTLDKALLSRFDDVFLMDTLSPINVAEVACLAVMKHWLAYGIEVVFTDPELILETVVKNEQFQEYGVRQLSSYIRMKSDAAMVEALRRGWKQVSLNLDARQEFVAAPWRKAS